MPSPMQEAEVGVLSFDEPIAELEPQTFVTYTKKDILSGRGGLANKHSGNRVFRRLIKFNKDAYRNLKSKRKQNMLIESILLALERQGARFLRQVDKSDMWFEIDRKDAWAKTSQALREPDKKGEDDESSAKSSISKAQAAVPRPKINLNVPAKPTALARQESAPFHPNMFDYNPAVNESIVQAQGDNEGDADLEPVSLYQSLSDISQPTLTSMFSEFSDVQLQSSGSIAYESSGVFACPMRRSARQAEAARSNEWSRPAHLRMSESLSTLPPLLRMTSSIFCKTLEELYEEDAGDTTADNNMAPV